MTTLFSYAIFKKAGMTGLFLLSIVCFIICAIHRIITGHWPESN